MRRTHAELDRPASPYVEGTNEDNVPLYRRAGTGAWTCAIHLPDGSPFFRMWRPPGD